MENGKFTGMKCKIHVRKRYVCVGGEIRLQEVLMASRNLSAILRNLNNREPWRMTSLGLHLGRLKKIAIT